MTFRREITTSLFSPGREEKGYLSFYIGAWEGVLGNEAAKLKVDGVHARSIRARPTVNKLNRLIVHFSLQCRNRCAMYEA
jgi:hypothetical protein